MKRVLGIAFFSYCFLLSLLLGASSVSAVLQTTIFSPQLLFLPIPLYFIAIAATAMVRPKQGSFEQLYRTKTGPWGILHTYYNFIITNIMAVMGFVAAKSVSQMVSAVIFAPLAIYFARLVLPKAGRAILMVPQPKKVPTLKHLPLKKVPMKVAAIPLPAKTEPVALDANKRMFLKLIGSAGVSLFFFSLFSKKAHAAFFGSVPGPGTLAIKDTTGAAVDPAIKQPTDGYRINQIDDTSSGTYSYYGYTNKDADWFIMRETTSGANAGDYRYYKKKITDGTFATEWSNRATLSPYDYFDEIF